MSLPDFSQKELVEQETQREEGHALDEGGDEHPAQGICVERVLIGVDAVAAEDLDLYVCPRQMHQPVPKVKLGEDEEGVAQPFVDNLDELQGEKLEEAAENMLILTFSCHWTWDKFVLHTPLQLNITRATRLNSTGNEKSHI